MAVQATRQEIVRVLRKTGFTEVAESPSVSPFPTCVRGRVVEVGSVSGREDAPGGRVHDQDRLSDRELPRPCLPSGVDVSTSTLRYLSACGEPADAQPAPSVRMRSTRLGSSRSSPVAASNMIRAGRVPLGR
jgi:hypothetical protein